MVKKRIKIIAVCSCLGLLAALIGWRAFTVVKKSSDLETALDSKVVTNELILANCEANRIKVNGDYIKIARFRDILFSDGESIYFLDENDAHEVKKMDQKRLVFDYFRSPYYICGAFGKDVYRVIIQGKYYAFNSIEDALYPEEECRLSTHRKDDSIAFSYKGEEHSINQSLATEDNDISKALDGYKIGKGDLVSKIGEKIYYYFTVVISPVLRYELYFRYDIEKHALSFVDYFRYSFDSVKAIANNTNWGW